MSEYQLYEFYKLDGRLSAKEREAVEALSSHAEVSDHSLTIEYHYGDFKHEPIKVLRQYFDLYFYYSAWGSLQLAIRLPAHLVDGKRLAAYRASQEQMHGYGDVEIKKMDEDIIVDINLNEEEGFSEWREPDGSKLAPLREAILRGDDRPLFLAWLTSVSVLFGMDEDEWEEPDQPLPPIPPGLDQLDVAQRAFVDLFYIPQELVLAAHRLGPKQAAMTEAADEAGLLDRLPEAEKDHFLRELLNGRPRLDLELRRRLRELSGEKGPKASTTSNHTVADLLREAAVIHQQEAAAAAERAAQAHVERMRQLGPREPGLWQQIDRLMLTSSTKSYQEAVVVLKDLHDLYRFQKKEKAWREKLAVLKERYSRRAAFQRELEKAGLG